VESILKILTVVYNFDKGGTQRAAQVFSEGYHELGHDSKVLCLYGLGVRYDEVKDTLKVWDTLLDNHLQQIKEWDPDVIHIHSHGPKIEDVNRLLNTIKKAKVIETNVFSIPSPWAEKVDVSFQLSNWAQWIFDIRGGKKYNSNIVPYPIKCNAFKRASTEKVKQFKSLNNIPENAFIMGRIGQSFPGKWSPMLVDIFNDLAKENDNLYLLIVNAPNNILDLMKQSFYKNRIVSISSIFGDENLATAYSSMDTMVLIAEQGESFGMVLAESILCETPVVTLSTPWADNSQCEVVGNCLGGYVAHRAAGIKQALASLISNETLQYSKEKGVAHIYGEYNYLGIAQRALDAITNPNKNTSKDILPIFKNAVDTSDVVTRALLKMDNDLLRKLTMYSTGYKSWSCLLHRVADKMFNHK